MLDRERRLIVVHIQKTGGSSIAAALGLPDARPEKHRTAVELRALYGEAIWSKCFKFAVVRNPWDRLVSWWSMIDRRRQDYERGASLVPFHRYVLSRATTFAEFLLNCGDDFVDIDGDKSIWRNQLDYVTDSDGSVIVDRVGRFENLKADWDAAAATACGERVPLPHLNGTSHPHYATFYAPALADLVARRYARDIAAFGYDFEAATA